MTFKKLAGILVLVLLTTSCQQAALNSTKPFYAETNGAISPDDFTTAGLGKDLGSVDRSKFSRDLNTREKVSLFGDGGESKSHPKRGSGANLALIEKNLNPNELDDSKAPDETLSKELNQEKIDQALELCNFAQEMWEAGNLDEALSNLDSAYFLILDIDSSTSLELNQQKEDVRYLISKRILEIYASRQMVVTGQHDEIPITLNEHVQTEIDLLTGPERNFFIRAMERSSRYRPFIVEELKKAGLPEEISWLPLIESGYKLRALSTARALGLWQFIPSTGYKFGLNRNYYIDDRMDPEKSTQAAIAYLKELHQLFGDWTTALAAYNCGENRVLKTIEGQKINYLDNFWDLYQKLPRETARYVPRFLATLHIVNNLEKYNMVIENPQSPIEYETFEIKKKVRLKDIAREIDVPIETLKQLNPDLRYALLPPEAYQLKLPKGKTPALLSKLDSIEISHPPSQVTAVYHRVKKGETLSKIADKYKMSVQDICEANRVSKNHNIVVGQVLKVGMEQAENEADLPNPQVKNQTQASNQAQAKIKAKPEKPLSYKVKPGDNLWNIANQFSTTTKQIMASNKLPSTTLVVGQTLSLASSNTASSKKTNPVYQVKSGDSAALIAKQHKMSLNRLLVLNHLNKRSKIFPGQKLIVE